ncbi:MAG: DUF6448 family protein [Pseudomonadota bacterium]
MKAKIMSMVIAIFVGLLMLYPQLVYAHCDTLDGPVVMAAKIALEKGDVTPVLKWVKKEHEEEIREAFKKILNVRTKGPEARELADQYFFETLVRIHRAGERAPYTGLKPAGAVEPIVASADKALESGSIGTLVKTVTDEAASGIRKRFDQALEKKKHGDESVEAGREFVEAYIEFVHYVERLYKDAKGHAAHHGGELKESGQKCPFHSE